jgi:hypothetical protein
MFSLWLSTSFDRPRLTHILATRRQPSFEVSFNDFLYYHLIHYLSCNKWRHFRFQHKSIHVCECLDQEVLAIDLTLYEKIVGSYEARMNIFQNINVLLSPSYIGLGTPAQCRHFADA